MSRRTLAGLAAALLAAASPARADNPGTTAAPFLQVPRGARALGMGAAFTAVGDDASALGYNPAGLARLSAQELDATYVSGAGEASLQDFDYAVPLPWTGLSGNGWSTLAGGLLFSQSGSIQVNTLNSNGSLQSSQTLSAGSDLDASLAYAESAGTTSFEIPGSGTYTVNHFLGVEGELVRSTLVQSYTATTFAGGAGYLARCPEEGLSAGLSALHLGSGLRYVSASDPLPSSLRGGVAWENDFPGRQSLLTAADIEYVLHEKAWHPNFGLEYVSLGTYALRLGYQFHRGDQGGLTVGLGFHWQDRFLVDYAWSVGDSFSAAQRFTLGYRFGAVSAAQRGSERRPYVEEPLERQPPEPGLDQRRIEAPPAPLPREPQQGVPGWIY